MFIKTCLIKSTENNLWNGLHVYDFVYYPILCLHLKFLLKNVKLWPNTIVNIIKNVAEIFVKKANKVMLKETIKETVDGGC